MFCEKPPKGFEKYFKPGGAAAKDAKSAAATESSTAPSSSASKTPPLSKPPGATSEAKPKSSNDWNFGMFGPTASKGGGSGGGRPIGGSGDGNDREKWLLLGALGIVGLIGTLTFMEINYKEIGWKEFVNK